MADGEVDEIACKYCGATVDIRSNISVMPGKPHLHRWWGWCMKCGWLSRPFESLNRLTIYLQGGEYQPSGERTPAA